MKLANAIGKTFNRLTVKSAAPENPYIASRALLVNCSCSCGKTTVVALSSVLSNHTKSCGCLVYDTPKNRTHGMSYTDENQVWRDMWQRCTNPNNPYYELYKDRVPPASWKSFETFFADMGPRPGKGYSLDRVDNSKPYGPTNCRWATRKEQNRNKSKTVYVEYEGSRIALADLTDRYNVPYDRVYVRVMKLGWELTRALTQPPRQLS